MQMSVLRPLLIVLCGFFSIQGCVTHTESLFPWEHDSVFNTGQRTILRPYGDPWVYYYFPSESADSLRRKIETSEFFKNAQLREFRPRRPEGYFSSKSNSIEGEVATVTIFQGKLNVNLEDLDSPAGATVVIIINSGAVP